MKLTKLAVVVLTAAAALLIFYAADCQSVETGSARIGTNTSYTLRLPLTRSCGILPTFISKFLPSPKISSVQLVGDNVSLGDWKLLPEQHSIELPLSWTNEALTGRVDTINLSFSNGRQHQADVKALFRSSVYDAEAFGTRKVFVYPLFYTRGKLTGAALTRYVKKNAAPLHSLGARVVYPELFAFGVYWTPLASFDPLNPYSPPVESIDLTKPATIPPEDGVFFFDLEAAAPKEEPSVVCLATLVTLKGRQDFGIGQCEETVSYSIK